MKIRFLILLCSMVGLFAQGNQQAVITFSTIADMVARANPRNPAATTVEVLGYYAPHDGGGGSFLGTNIVTSTNFGTRIMSGVAGWSWERIRPVGRVESAWFGVINGGVDVTARMQDAVDVIDADGGGTVFVAAAFNGGIFTIDSIDHPGRVNIVGLGDPPTIRHLSTPSGPMFSMTTDYSKQGIVFENLILDGSDASISDTNYWEEAIVIQASGRVDFKNLLITNVFRSGVENYYGRPVEFAFDNVRIKNIRTMSPQGSPANPGAMSTAGIRIALGVTNMIGYLKADRLTIMNDVRSTNRYPGSIYLIGGQYAENSYVQSDIQRFHFENLAGPVSYDGNESLTLRNGVITNWTFGALSIDNGYRFTVENVKVYGSGNRYAHEQAAYAGGHNGALFLGTISRSIFATNDYQYGLVKNVFIKGDSLSSTEPAVAENGLYIRGNDASRPFGNVKVENLHIEGFTNAIRTVNTTNVIEISDSDFHGIGESPQGVIDMRDGSGVIRFSDVRVWSTNENGISSPSAQSRVEMDDVRSTHVGGTHYPAVFSGTTNVAVKGGRFSNPSGFYGLVFTTGTGEVDLGSDVEIDAPSGVWFTDNTTVASGFIPGSGAPANIAAKKHTIYWQINSTDGLNPMFIKATDEDDLLGWERPILPTNPQFITSIGVNVAASGSQAVPAKLHGSANTLVHLEVRNTSGGNAASTGYTFYNDAGNVTQMYLYGSGHATKANYVEWVAGLNIVSMDRNTISASTPHRWLVANVEKVRINSTGMDFNYVTSDRVAIFDGNGVLTNSSVSTNQLHQLNDLDTGAGTIEQRLDALGVGIGNYVADVVGTANQISVSHTPAPGSTATLSFPGTVDFLGTTLLLPVEASPNITVEGGIAFDQGAYAPGFGAFQAWDGTQRTYLLGVQLSDAPVNGQTIKYNNGTITWEDDLSDPGATDNISVNGVAVTDVNFKDAGTDISFELETSTTPDETIAFFARNAVIGSDPALAANHATFGASGVVFEGPSADTIEGLLNTVTLTADRTWSLPDASVTLAGLETPQTFTANQTFNGAILQPADTIGASDIDWSTGNMFLKSISGNTTFTFSGATAAQWITVKVTAAGANTVTWPTVTWRGGLTPSQTSTKTDFYTFFYDGTTYYGEASQNY